MSTPSGPKPRFLDDEAYRSLREGDTARFAQLTAGRERIDFSDADLRGVDLRGVDASRLVLRGAYLRDADLRGLDLRRTDLEGASLYHARISGAYFPPELTPEEIRLSVELGTRLRVRRG